MTCCRVSNSNLSIGELQSNADCILYTYGVGDSQTQAFPPYFLELARRNPTLSHEMIHCDEVLEDKTVTVSSNLSVRFIRQFFPTSRSFDPQFQDYLRKKLEQGKEIFLGVHNACWTDIQCCLGETYNLFYEKYRGKIHFYIQSGKVPAFVYKGPYHPIMGLFAQKIYYLEPSIWDSYQRLFSEKTPDQADSQMVKKSMIDLFLTNVLFIGAEERDEAACTVPISELLKYVDKPLANRLIVLPLNALTPEIFSAPPGEEPLRESISYFKNYRPFVETISNMFKRLIGFF